MLERAVLRRNSEDSGAVSVSRLLDAMIYYGKVHVVLDLSGFLSLYEQLGATGLNALFGYSGLSFEFTPQFNGIRTSTEDGQRVHKPVFGKLSLSEKQTSTIDIIANRLNKSPREPKPSRQLIESIVHKGRQTTFEKIFGSLEKAEDSFFSLVTDPDTLRLGIRQRANSLGISINAEALARARFQSMTSNRNLFISSTPDIRQLLRREDGAEQWPHVLALLLDYCIDLHLSQTRSADVLVNPQTAQISQDRNDLALSRGVRSGALIDDFEQIAFDSDVRLGNAYDAGAVDLRGALNLIDKGRKFRQWVSNIDSDEHLIKEYMQAVEAGTILDTVPGKTVRFAIVTGAPTAIGAVDPLSGVVAAGLLGLFDTMFLEHLVRGWRPNRFVDQLQQSLKS